MRWFSKWSHTAISYSTNINSILIVWLLCDLFYACLIHKAKALSAVGNSETLLKKSTNAELAKLDKTLNTIIPKEVDDEREVDCDLEGPNQFIFEENESLRAKTTDERIGRVFTTFQISETKANQSTTEGK